MYSAGILTGGGITSSPSSSGKGRRRGGGLRGIFGIVQHHSSLVQDAFFSEVWPARQADHCQGKDDHHTHRQVAAGAEKRGFSCHLQPGRADLPPSLQPP